MGREEVVAQRTQNVLDGLKNEIGGAYDDGKVDQAAIGSNVPQQVIDKAVADATASLQSQNSVLQSQNGTLSTQLSSAQSELASAKAKHAEELSAMKAELKAIEDEIDKLGEPAAPAPVDPPADPAPEAPAQ